jgi:carbamoyl-phosphate synthase large subunit
MLLQENKNILITSAGRRVSLVNAFKKEARTLLGENSKVFTTDLYPALSSACQTADGAFAIGKFTDENYIDSLVAICKQNNIGIIIPTIDTELLLLSTNLEKFDKINCSVIISDAYFIKICRDKRLTNQFFLDHGINVPIEYTKNTIQYPTFIKPFNGSSSNNLLLAHSKDDIALNILNNPDMMFLEYLAKKDFDEYTVDIYYDRNSVIKSIIPRLRIETRQGEISKGITLNNFIVPFVLENLNNINGYRGCMTLQLFANKKTTKIYGIEINPRFGGGFPLSYLAGANFVKWILQEYILGESVEYFEGWKKNLLLLRHDTELIIENGFVA